MAVPGCEELSWLEKSIATISTATASTQQQRRTASAGVGEEDGGDAVECKMRR